MKNLLLNSFLLFFSNVITGQNPLDSVELKLSDDCRSKIHVLTQAKNKLEYDLYFSKNYKKTITVYNNKDSSLFTYLNKQNKIIRQEKNVFYSGHKSDSIVRYFNTTGVIEYTEYWSCSVIIHNEDGSSTITRVEPYLQTRTRIGYDSNGREIVTALLTPYVKNRTVKLYDKKGNLVKTEFEEIKEHQFWE